MSKTKNHRKLRKRRGGDPDDPSTATGQTQPPVTELGQSAAPVPQPQDQKEPSGFDMSPPPLTQPVQRQLPGQAPVQAQTPVVEPPPTPSFWDKLTSPFKKKPETTTTSQPTGLFSSNPNISFFKPSTWFGGKTKRHGKNKKSKKAKKAKKAKKSKKSKSKNH